MPGPGAAAPLTIIKRDGQERQRRGQLIADGHGPEQALQGPGGPCDVQDHDEQHPDGPIIRAEELRQHGQSQGAENARGAPLPAMPQTAQGAQPEKERPVNVLVAPVDQRVEKGQVKGELAHQRKGQHPPGVLPEAVGVQEALHQQEAVDTGGGNGKKFRHGFIMSISVFLP